MFTGIIRTMGTVESRKAGSAGDTLTVAASELATNLAPGDSIAVNGVCQTVEKVNGDRFTFTAVGETLGRTTLSALSPGSRVNLEPAATPQTALGGHIVQGHVDGVGVVRSFERAGKDYLLAVDVPGEVFACTVEKGSITIDGVSLTVVSAQAPGRVTITIIPFTMDETIIGKYEVGTRVNVEADIIGKYVRKYVEQLHGSTPR
jgi:riboflavin synthase